MAYAGSYSIIRENFVLYVVNISPLPNLAGAGEVPFVTATYQSILMSLETIVYCEEVTEALLRKAIERLNEFDMTVELDPGFTLSSGKLTFRYQLSDPPIEALRGKQLKTGIKFYIKDFDLTEAKKALNPKPGLWASLFGKKRPEVPFACPVADLRLAECRQTISFVWHAGDSFQFRFASLASAVLTEIANGVCFYPADDLWHNADKIVEEAFEEVQTYEKAVRAKDLKYEEFKGWV